MSFKIEETTRELVGRPIGQLESLLAQKVFFFFFLNFVFVPIFGGFDLRGNAERPTLGLVQVLVSIQLW